MVREEDEKYKDVGWMYYSPNRREDKEAVICPVVSQIPGLGEPGPNEPPQEERRNMIKETDSPYIRLAKQGGRQDLLAFRENKPKMEPIGYPRCEWFYHDDPADAEKNEAPYVFQLPEYMVHKEPSLNNIYEGGNAYYTPSRLPYAVDTTTVYERDGANATNKTMRIPNARRAGYGVRLEKQLKDPIPQKQTVQNPNHRSRRPLGPDMGHDNDPTNMYKLMANTYEREWHQRRRDWEAKQASEKKAGGGKVASEYREAFHANVDEKAKRSDYAARSKHRMDDDPKEARHIDREIEKMEKELFKLSRFKNVSARVDTNRKGAAHSDLTLYEPSQSDAPKRTTVVT